MSEPYVLSLETIREADVHGEQIRAMHGTTLSDVLCASFVRPFDVLCASFVRGFASFRSGFLRTATTQGLAGEGVTDLGRGAGGEGYRNLKS
jgi:hypothetical protein